MSQVDMCIDMYTDGLGTPSNDMSQVGPTGLGVGLLLNLFFFFY